MQQQQTQQKTFVSDELVFRLCILNAQQERHIQFNHRNSNALKMHTAQSHKPNNIAKYDFVWSQLLPLSIYFECNAVLNSYD